MIFVLLRFYVKLIFGVLEGANSAILTHLEALNFGFYNILHFWYADFYSSNKIQNP